MCITHLPQIASQAKVHYKVEKYEKDGRTKVSIKKLNYDERKEEIARMLGGEKVTKVVIEHAEELLKRNLQRKDKI